MELEYSKLILLKQSLFHVLEWPFSIVAQSVPQDEV